MKVELSLPGELGKLLLELAIPVNSVALRRCNNFNALH
jgi:hypothetical protein